MLVPMIVNILIMAGFMYAVSLALHGLFGSDSDRGADSWDDTESDEFEVDDWGRDEWERNEWDDDDEWRY